MLKRIGDPLQINTSILYEKLHPLRDRYSAFARIGRFDIPAYRLLQTNEGVGDSWCCHLFLELLSTADRWRSQLEIENGEERVPLTATPSILTPVRALIQLRGGWTNQYHCRDTGIASYSEL
jgi:hypothetical protein